MKQLKTVACVVVVLCQTACGTSMNSSDSTGPEYGDLTVGAHGTDVLNVRSFLSRYGYFPNDELRARYPDWKPMVPSSAGDAQRFDEGLALALVKYQRNMGLNPTGNLDAATREAMAVPRCAVPDTDPDDSTEAKWALFGSSSVWKKTTIKYKFKKPNDALLGQTAATTKSNIRTGIQEWQQTTNLTFTEVTSGEDVLIDYAVIGGLGLADANPLPNPSMRFDTTTTFSATKLRLAATHESGHLIGLHHSSHFSSATPVPVMGPTGNVSGELTSDDKIASNVRYNSWEKLPGLAIDISVAGLNVWIIGIDANEPYRWNGSNWVKVPLGQRCWRIDVGTDGVPWVVTRSNRIYRYEGSWVEAPGGGRAIDIGRGRDDATFVVGTDGRIYGSTASGWSFIGGPLNSVSVDASGDSGDGYYAVDSNKIIWQCFGDVCAQAGGGFGLDVSVGTPRFFDFGFDDWAWAIGLNDTIWARNVQAAIVAADPRSNAPAADTWQQASGAARRISVGEHGRPWIVASNGEIYRRRELDD